jgi:hypothetical protein
MERGAYAESLAKVTAHLEAGRSNRAAALAAQLDEQAAAILGMSHPDALRIREVRARVAALSGDGAGGVWLYRDIAERWHYRGDGERAEIAAARAETLWLQITDLETALSAGIAVIRMRNQIPGEHNALADALEHQGRLAAASATGRPLPRAHAVADPPPTRGSRRILSWERPARQTRTAG